MGVPTIANASSRRPWETAGSPAVIATMHGKERAIRPALASLNLRWQPLPCGFDTDRFGTFTREVKRPGTALETARAKARSALEAVREARFAIASEGSFGPHPQFGMLVSGQETILLLDRDSGLELVGTDFSLETNFSHRRVTSLRGALTFAEQVGFPEHGLIVMSSDGQRIIDKELTSLSSLKEHCRRLFADRGAAWLEADMRAHRNPTRMRAIARAARNLVDAAAARCPVCAMPGFLARRTSGRPCEICCAATLEEWAEERSCASCGFAQQTLIDPDRLASPGLCPECNP